MTLSLLSKAALVLAGMLIVLGAAVGMARVFRGKRS